MNDREIRIAVEPLKVERRAEGKGGVIVGYAAVFNKPVSIAGVFTEIVRPGAFRKSIADKDDVPCLFNHDHNLVLGRTASGTLSLVEDERGLRFECTPPDTAAGRDIIALVERGDVRGCSFGFLPRPGGQLWTRDDSGETRELTDVELLDVAPVTQPAYPETEIALRTLSAARDLRPNPNPGIIIRVRLAEAELP